MIPKIIHYCWFGRNKKTFIVEKCIQSWKVELKDYIFMEWNDDNSDLNHNFLKYAYHEKKWAFVSDYIRLKALYEYGGIYLDTDMFVLKKMDDLLNSDAFIGTEDGKYISAGIIGAKKKSECLRCLEFYNNYKTGDEFIWFNNTLPKIVSKIINTEKLPLNNEILLNGIKVYPQKYFYPLTYVARNNFLFNTLKKYQNSYAVHLWEGNWLEKDEFYYIRNRKYYLGFVKVVKQLIKNKNKLTYLKKVFRQIFRSFNF